MRSIPLAAALLLSLACAGTARAQQAVLLVRHAEKVDESEDAALSAAGQARAARLAQHQRSAGITAIYSTPFQRTVDTVKPLAAALGLEVRVHPVADSAGLVKKLRKDHGKDVVLLSGHTDTLPELLKRLGHPTPLVEIPSSEYDNLFVVVPRAGGRPQVLRLRY
jgi:2,3-bisphosphoglycerate-dependent phosphoglycerate mutase